MPPCGGRSSPLAVNGISLGWLRSTIGSPVASSMPLTFPALCTVMSAGRSLLSKRRRAGICCCGSNGRRLTRSEKIPSFRNLDISWTNWGKDFWTAAFSTDRHPHPRQEAAQHQLPQREPERPAIRPISSRHRARPQIPQQIRRCPLQQQQVQNQQEGAAIPSPH